MIMFAKLARNTMYPDRKLPVGFAVMVATAGTTNDVLLFREV
jgi:hypothetical protein